jgi:hypothetical protein
MDNTPGGANKCTFSTDLFVNVNVNVNESLFDSIIQLKGTSILDGTN